MSKPQAQLPQVLMTPFELMRAAQGHPMTTRVYNGAEVCVRIPTADEMEVIIRDAQATMPSPPPMPVRAQIEDLVRPLAAELPPAGLHRGDVLNYEHFDCCGQGMVPKVSDFSAGVRHQGRPVDPRDNIPASPKENKQ